MCLTDAAAPLLSPSAAVYLRQRDAGPPPAPILRCYQSPDHDRQEGPQRCPIPMFPAPHVHRSAVARYGCAEIWINVAPCAIGRTGPSPAALLPPSLFTRSAPGRRFGWRARCNFVLPGGLPPTHAARSAALLARGRDRRRPACVVGSGQALRCAWTRPPPPPPSCSAALRLVRSAGQLKWHPRELSWAAPKLAATRAASGCCQTLATAGRLKMACTTGNCYRKYADCPARPSKLLAPSRADRLHLCAPSPDESNSCPQRKV